MNWDTEGFLKFHKTICDEARELSRRKNHDYADPENRKDDPLAVWRNFTQSESLTGVATAPGILVRLSDKFSRFCNLMNPRHERAVADESIEDTAKDIINYVCLVLGYRIAEKEWRDSLARLEKKGKEEH